MKNVIWRHLYLQQEKLHIWYRISFTDGTYLFPNSNLGIYTFFTLIGLNFISCSKFLILVLENTENWLQIL